jgi:hypothetical protein
MTKIPRSSCAIAVVLQFLLLVEAACREHQFVTSSLDGIALVADVIVVGEATAKRTFYGVRGNREVYVYRIRVHKAIPSSLRSGTEIIVEAEQPRGFTPEIYGDPGQESLMVLRREPWGYRLLAGYKIAEVENRNLIILGAFYDEFPSVKASVEQLFARVEDRAKKLCEFIRRPKEPGTQRLFAFKERGFFGWFVLNPNQTAQIGHHISIRELDDIEWKPTSNGVELTDPEGFHMDQVELERLSSARPEEFLVGGRLTEPKSVWIVWAASIETSGDLLQDAAKRQDENRTVR